MDDLETGFECQTSDAVAAAACLNRQIGRAVVCTKSMHAFNAYSPVGVRGLAQRAAFCVSLDMFGRVGIQTTFNDEEMNQEQRIPILCHVVLDVARTLIRCSVRGRKSANAYSLQYAFVQHAVEAPQWSLHLLDVLSHISDYLLDLHRLRALTLAFEV